MVFLVPDIYNQIKERGRAEGIVKGRAEGRVKGREEGIAKGMEEGRAKGRAAVAAAMREAGVDDETIRRVEAIARRARRNDN